MDKKVKGKRRCDKWPVISKESAERVEAQYSRQIARRERRHVRIRD